MNQHALFLIVLGAALVLSPASSPLELSVQVSEAKKKKKKKHSNCRSRDNGNLKEKKTDKRFVNLNDEMCRDIEDRFPNIHKKKWAILDWGSNGSYNCFAHSVGINNQVIKDSHVNPKGTPTIADWDKFYAKHGLKKAKSRVQTKAIVVLYGERKDRPGHAARLSKIKLGTTRMYESKLGSSHLLLHHVKGLKGGSYGSAIRSYK